MVVVNGLLEKFKGGLVILALGVKLAQIVVGPGIGWVKLNGLLVGGNGIFAYEFWED